MRRLRWKGVAAKPNSAVSHQKAGWNGMPAASGIHELCGLWPKASRWWLWNGRRNYDWWQSRKPSIRTSMPAIVRWLATSTSSREGWSLTIKISSRDLHLPKQCERRESCASDHDTRTYPCNWHVSNKHGSIAQLRATGLYGNSSGELVWRMQHMEWSYRRAGAELSKTWSTMCETSCSAVCQGQSEL